MKSNAEIIGLPLMGIQDGYDCGKVHDIIFSVEQKNAQFLVLDSGSGLFGMNVLGFSKITGIGQDMLTTQSGADIRPLWENKEAISLGYTSFQLLGARVISNEGNIAGRVSEFYLDDKTGAIEHLVLDNGATVPGEDILTLSVNSVFTSGPIMNIPKLTIEKPVPKAEAPQSAPKEQIKPDPSLSGLFQKRQMEYLVGREITKDIKAKGGKTLAKSGDIVTEDLVRRIKDEGRMPELALNVK